MPDDKNKRLPRCIGLVLLAAVSAAVLAVGGKGASGARPTVLSFAVAAGEPSVLYAGTSDGIYTSGDGGRTWRRTLQAGGQYQGLAVDPSDPAIVYAAPSEGLYRHGRDGRWRLVNSFMGDAWLVHDPKRSGILWVETGSGSLYGPAGDALASRGPRRTVQPGSPLVVDPKTPNTAYVVSGESGRIYRTTNGGKWWTTNGSKWWPLVGKGLPSGIEVLAIDPKRPRTLYAGDSNGLFKTTDGGTTWRALGVLWRDDHAHALAVDPRRPSTLYAYSYADGFFKSTDGGRTWNHADKGLPGFGPTRAGHYVVVDPRDTDSVYVLTPSRGVYKSTDGARSWHRIAQPGASG